MLFFIVNGENITGTVSGNLDPSDAVARGWIPVPEELDANHSLACYSFVDGEILLKGNWAEIEALEKVDVTPTNTAEDYRTIKLNQLREAYGAVVYTPYTHTDGNVYVGGRESAGLIQDGIDTQQANGEATITIWTIEDQPVPMTLEEASALVAALGKMLQAQFQYKKTVERQYLDVDVSANDARDQLDAITYDFALA